MIVLPDLNWYEFMIHNYCGVFHKHCLAQKISWLSSILIIMIEILRHISVAIFKLNLGYSFGSGYLTYVTSFDSCFMNSVLQMTKFSPSANSNILQTSAFLEPYPEPPCVPSQPTLLHKPFIGFWQPRKAGLNKHTGKSCVHKIHNIHYTIYTKSHHWKW